MNFNGKEDHGMSKVLYYRVNKLLCPQWVNNKVVNLVSTLMFGSGKEFFTEGL